MNPSFTNEIQKLAISSKAIRGAVQKRLANLKEVEQASYVFDNPGLIEAAERGTSAQFRRIADKHQKLYLNPALAERSAAEGALKARFGYRTHLENPTAPPIATKGVDRGKGNFYKALDRFSKAEATVQRRRSISGYGGLLRDPKHELYGVLAGEAKKKVA